MLLLYADGYLAFIQMNKNLTDLLDDSVECTTNPPLQLSSNSFFLQTQRTSGLSLQQWKTQSCRWEKFIYGNLCVYIVQISWCLLKGLYQQVGSVYSNFDRMRNIEKTSKPKHCSFFSSWTWRNTTWFKEGPNTCGLRSIKDSSEPRSVTSRHQQWPKKPQQLLISIKKIKKEQNSISDFKIIHGIDWY